MHINGSTHGANYKTYLSVCVLANFRKGWTDLTRVSLTADVSESNMA